MDDASTPEPNVLLMIGLSLGLWGLLALGIISAWTRQVGPEQTASHKDAPPPAMPRHATRYILQGARRHISYSRNTGPAPRWMALRVFSPSPRGPSAPCARVYRRKQRKCSGDAKVRGAEGRMPSH